MWANFALVLDIDRLIRREEIDIELAIAHARDWNAERILLLGIGMAVRSLNSPVSDSVRKRLRNDAESGELVEYFLSRLFKGEGLTSVGWRKMAGLHMRMREKTSTRARYLASLLRTKATDSLFLPMGRPQ